MISQQFRKMVNPRAAFEEILWGSENRSEFEKGLMFGRHQVINSLKDLHLRDSDREDKLLILDAVQICFDLFDSQKSGDLSDFWRGRQIGVAEMLATIENLTY